MKLVENNIKDLTLQQMFDELSKLRSSLLQVDENITPGYMAVQAGCDIFRRFIPVIMTNFNNSVSLGEYILACGNDAIENFSESVSKIRKQASYFIKDGCSILVHGNSRCVAACLDIENLTGKVYVCNADGHGNKFVQKLKSQNCSDRLDIQIIADTNVAYFMDKVDFCLTGAEGITENGGLVNQIGTFQLALLARNFNKPFYCASESFKFTRSYPLSQGDVKNKDINYPKVDMTPPELISLFFTDLGALTPSAVCDELIKLYE